MGNVKLYSVMSNLVYKKKRPSKIWGYQKEEETPEHVLYFNPITKHGIISIRGTKNIDDIVTDVKIPLIGETDRHKSELKFYDDMKSKYKNVTLTGHSLGGNLSDYISKKRDTNAITFNPYILGEASKKNVIFRTKHDPVSILTSSKNINIVKKQEDKDLHTINQFVELIES